MAREITTGTKTPEIRSASRWIGALDPCASCTRRMIWESTVSCPTRATRKWKAPFRLSVAPMTRSPRSPGDRHRLAGKHGLVHIAGAFEDHSVGRNLFARAAPRPHRPPAAGPARSPPLLPSRRTRAVEGRKPIRRRSAPEVRPFARASSRLPSSTSAMIQVTAS